MEKHFSGFFIATIAALSIFLVIQNEREKKRERELQKRWNYIDFMLNELFESRKLDQKLLDSHERMITIIAALPDQIAERVAARMGKGRRSSPTEQQSKIKI
jgi:hypothetical protein